MYKGVILKQAPRLLGLVDRAPLSKTFGCFDRNYWHYKTSDFPCARLQEGVLTLAYLYKTEGTVFHGNKQLLEWIRAGLDFWKNIQHKNGSFDEWYPNENSFVATAFSTYTITESLLLLKDDIDKGEYIEAVEKACNWISKRIESRAQNQEAGAILTLYNGYLVTSKEKFRKYAEDRMTNFLETQEAEGWFHEYGGADIGYLSVCIDYLAKYYKKTSDENVLNALKKSTGFLKYFLHPDMTAGGTYGSRNTEYLIPSGFEILSGLDENAQTIATHIIKGIEKGKMLGTDFLDDRYLVYNGYTYFEAFHNMNANKKYDPMYSKEFTKDFKTAGLIVISKNENYTILNYNNGGSFKNFENGKIKRSEPPISGKLGDNNLIGDVVTEVKMEKGKIIINGKFRQVPKQTISPIKNAMLRLFQISFGRSEKIGKIFREKMRNMLITNRKGIDIKFAREIEFDNGVIKVKDTIPDGMVQFRGDYSYDFIPSSKYFQYSNLV